MQILLIKKPQIYLRILLCNHSIFSILYFLCLFEIFIYSILYFFKRKKGVKFFYFRNHKSSSISSGNTVKNNNILTISSTFKAKNKFYTVLYYKPIN